MLMFFLALIPLMQKCQVKILDSLTMFVKISLKDVYYYSTHY